MIIVILVLLYNKFLINKYTPRPSHRDVRPYDQNPSIARDDPRHSRGPPSRAAGPALTRQFVTMPPSLSTSIMSNSVFSASQSSLAHPSPILLDKNRHASTVPSA